MASCNTLSTVWKKWKSSLKKVTGYPAIAHGSTVLDGRCASAQLFVVAVLTFSVVMAIPSPAQSALFSVTPGPNTMSQSEVEGSAPFVQSWNFTNTSGGTLFVSTSLGGSQSTGGPDGTDVPTFTNFTLSISPIPGNEFVQVSKNGTLSVSFTVNPPKLDSDKETPPDYGWASITISIFYNTQGASQVWNPGPSTPKCTYTVTDPGYVAPVPGTILLLVPGLVSLAAIRRRFKK